MQTLHLKNVPEQGQLVEVRQRQFVVTAVERNTLLPDTLPNGLEQHQHLISLASVEDDALGLTAPTIMSGPKLFYSRRWLGLIWMTTGR
jgi:hypothetical protein